MRAQEDDDLGSSRRGMIRLWAGHAFRWGKGLAQLASLLNFLWNGIGPSL